MRVKLIILVFTLGALLTNAQQKNDSISIYKKLEQVNVEAIRAKKESPISFSEMKKKEIEKVNLGQDLPYIISMTPSVVTTSDAGAGIGYTNFRIRGTDPTRINVTINGIPLNDAESQGVWWVNMPDFTSSVENIQIQRGVGSSTNGSSAFGASINLKTNDIKYNPYASTSNMIGSYSTYKNNIEFGTGLLNNSFMLDGRVSQIMSDGYIDRATSDLKSSYFQATYLNNNSILKGIIFTGKERTYQAWNGVPLRYLDSNRTYNSYTYENEVDNYTQTHYQLHYSKQLQENSLLNVSFHHTHGEGYYEQEKLGEDFTSYGLENLIFGADTIKNTDLIRRKWLNNDFSGLVFSLKQKLNNIDLNIGGSFNRYIGDHYGNIIWMKQASNANYNHQYYFNDAEKSNRNFYVKADYRINESTNLMLDIQNKRILYSFDGFNDNGESARQDVALDFTNPKAGIFHKLDNSQSIYASYSIGNKEPNRNDYVESSPNSRPQHETLHDIELGYKLVKYNTILSVNLYNMMYDNQLVLTGQINDVGAYTRTNVDNSFRRGIEIEGKQKLFNKLQIQANLTLSQNIINEYVEYVDNWDTWGQEQIVHKNTDLAFSPNVIWATQFNYKLTENLSLDINSKYVGEQYIDNTSSLDRKLDDYLTHNLQLQYNLNSKLFKTSKIYFRVNNVLDSEYVSNAWVYRFISDGYDPRADDHYVTKNSDGGYNMAGYFPEATRNYMLMLVLGF